MNNRHHTPESESEHRSPLLSGLILLVAVLSSLPIPVVALDLLPTYTMHARFLLFYAPVVCFLVMGYLLYIREQLGRLMFVDLLETGSSADEYYPTARRRMRARRLIGGVITLLPGVLLLASLYCVSRYVRRFEESVAIASGTLSSRLPASTPLDSAGVKVDSAAASPVPPASPGRSSSGDSSAEAQAAPPPPTDLATDPELLREHTLRTARIDDIPYFGELTTLYIGGIVCALSAVLLVLLKEYIRSTLRLSEAEVLVGGT